MRLIFRNTEKEIKSLFRSKFYIISLNTGLFFHWVSQPLQSAQETGNGFQSYSWHISTELLKVECPGILLKAIWQPVLAGEDSQAPAHSAPDTCQSLILCIFFKVPDVKKKQKTKKPLRQIDKVYSLRQNFVGFVLHWGGTGFGDEWQLDFAWRIASQVLGVLLILCKSVFMHWWNTVIKSTVSR